MVRAAARAVRVSRAHRGILKRAARGGAIIPLNNEAVRQAAALLVEARRSGVLLDGLPPACKPQSIDDAHAIQDATIALLGERVLGWKVGARQDGSVVRGALLESRVIANGGSIAAAKVPLLGVEAEVAFRFERDLPARERPYDYEEVAAAASAFAAIEIVDSRYRDYRNAPLLERIADCVSNGAFVQGSAQPRWRDFDLARLDVRLEIAGSVVVRHIGGHPAGDPLLPAVGLVNDFRLRRGVRAGLIMTTGTYTGLNFARPGERVTAQFERFGYANVELAQS